MPRQLKVHGHISAVFEALYQMSQNMRCCRPLGGVGGGVLGWRVVFSMDFWLRQRLGLDGGYFFFTPCYFEVDQIKICCPCML